MTVRCDYNSYRHVFSPVIERPKAERFDATAELASCAWQRDFSFNRRFSQFNVNFL
ncbi:hypothetical protein HMPREF0198_1010 [Cardiobacterium hominis ATCC 15826]|uniref:Uncharacterized protein n=1 Tax=Cardiobacterium hominis (strain ATCC 15826 / DSM 8339 / NCTC 10426 / 6573) TaxID=638300 RepID=C8N932_CARH6|nr:hypothetical protein HMPREF0198_1010 [Cardiobacterium hominis ATCC 15826]